MATPLIPLQIERSRQDNIYKAVQSDNRVEKEESSAFSSEIEEKTLASSESGTFSYMEENKASVSSGSVASGAKTEPYVPGNSYSAPKEDTVESSHTSSSFSSRSSSAPLSSESSPSQYSSAAQTSSKTQAIWPVWPNQESSRPVSSVPQTSSAGSSNMLDYAGQVVKLVNQERAKEGLSPLSISQPAKQAAQVRAREIENSFSHTRPNGTSFSTALKEQGVNYRTAGENIAWGQKTPEQVVQGWMNSPGHRANIMNANFTSIGVGYYRNASGINYWTQLFIG